MPQYFHFLIFFNFKQKIFKVVKFYFPITI